MIGTAPQRKRNPFTTIAITLLGLIIFAAICFALCDAIYLLNQSGVAPSS